MATRTKKPRRVQCELAMVKVWAVPHMDLIADLTVPAYTRPAEDLDSVVKTYLNEYIRLSTAQKAGMSVADFAFRLLGMAVDEPRTQ